MFLFLWCRRLGSNITSSRRVTSLEVGSVEGLGGSLAFVFNGFHGHKDVNIDQLSDSGVITRERRQDRFMIYILAFVVYVGDTGGYRVDVSILVVCLHH